MKNIPKSCGGGLGLIFLLCVCLSLIQIPSCSTETTGGDDNDYDPPPLVTVTPGPSPTPGGTTCSNAGVTYPDNPFSGWPQSGRSWSDVNYYYCAADYYVLFGRTHWGIDINAYTGEPLIATADALVVRASYDMVYGMGKNVKICTTTAWCAIYMHLDDWEVEQGDNVSAGDVLGYADNTGFSTGTHLHYQINDPAGQPVDPAPTFD